MTPIPAHPDLVEGLFGYEAVSSLEANPGHNFQMLPTWQTKST